MSTPGLKGIVPNVTSACSVARVAGWSACAHGGVRGGNTKLRGGMGARAKARAERQEESAAVVILPR